MLDLRQDDLYRPGPVFAVDDARAFHAAHRDRLHYRFAPRPIPGGYWSAFEDPAGNVVYVTDQSTAGEPAGA
jgi:hypothetical protein